ncbi:MAG: hypothetical protein IJZ23_08195 [Roseburia sp.]|nr:hypothetical protein [Roseburia sp.]
MNYLDMPALMKEQKETGKKDKYIEITNVLLEAADTVQTKEEKLSYMLALLETLEAMDFQIYELYRSLQDQFKVMLRELLSEYDGLGEAEKRMISDAIERGCGIRILLEEKYEAYVRKGE